VTAELAHMKKALYLVFILCVCSCSHYVINEAGYIRPPKDFKFSYKRKFASLTDLSVIDTTCIYYLTNSYFYKDSREYPNGDAYIRFYGNGKFKLQGLKHFPTPEEVNNPKTGIVGHYFVKDKVVKMQVYSDIGGGSTQLEFGYIDENKNLVVMHDNPRVHYGIGYNITKIKRLIARSNFSPKIYIKTPVEGINYTEPNW